VPERSDQVLLTYAELGERLGISPDGARMRAKRRHELGDWGIVAPNEKGGPVRVRLPAGDLPEQPPERSSARSPEVPFEHQANGADVPPNLAERVDELAANVAELGAAFARTLQAQSTLRAELAAERTRAAVAEARIEAERAAAEDRVAARNAVIEELRAMLADARRPWWRRLVG
jgi:hypothetical protein